MAQERLRPAVCLGGNIMRFRSAVPIGAFVVCALFAFATAAQSVLGVATGHPVDFTDVADLGTKKPKVKAVYTGGLISAKGDPKLKLKVTEFTANSFSVIVKKAKGSGNFDIQVKPKGGDTFIAGNLNVFASQPTSTNTDTVAPKGELTVTGTFFGSKKPKVFINGKKGKTLEFSDTSITVRAHKKTPGGMADIVVANKTGEGTLADAVTVTAPTPPISGSDRISGSVNGDYKTRLKMSNNEVRGSWKGAAGFTMFGKQETRSLDEEVDIRLNVDLDNAVLPLVVNVDVNAGEKCDFEWSDFVFKLYGLDPAGNSTSATVTIEEWDPANRRVKGTFEAELYDQVSGDRVSVGNGDFLVTLTDDRL